MYFEMENGALYHCKISAFFFFPPFRNNQKVTEAILAFCMSALTHLITFNNIRRSSGQN
jgi:hypothetical protein